MFFLYLTFCICVEIFNVKGDNFSDRELNETAQSRHSSQL